MKNGKIKELDGSIYHYKDDVIHRLDGPAIQSIYGYNYFFINGKQKFKNDFINETNHIKCNYCFAFCKQKCFMR